MSDWIELSIRVPQGLEELAAEAFCQPPFTGFSTEPGGVKTWMSAAHGSASERSELRSRLLGLGALDVEFRDVPGQDVLQLTRDRWRAFRVGRLAIVPRRASPRLRDGDVPLRLDPGGAFGTGRHGSTRGALALLQRFVAAGDRVLDAGSGSGILAVAAVLLGAKSAVGFDLDPNAKEHGDSLARDNGVADRCRFLECGFSGMAGEAAGFDGVLANLYLDLILDHAAALRDRLAPGGWFVVSGVRISERERLRETLRGVGLEPEVETRRGAWLSTAGRRSPPRAER